MPLTNNQQTFITLQRSIMWLRHWNFTRRIRVEIPMAPYESMVASGRASGHNCSRAPEESRVIQGNV